MFESLSDNLAKVFSKLKGKSYILEEDIAGAMREVRIALLSADVSLPVVKDFINKVKERSIGEQVIKNISPSNMIIKIVKECLEEVLGSNNLEVDLNTKSPAVIMMVGLQASGKTTTSGKLAYFLKNKKNKKVLLASLDIYRPAAQEQLEILASQNNIDSFLLKNKSPVKIAEKALEEAKKKGFDVLILDTAGRLHTDKDMMSELKKIKKVTSPIETFLVADSLTGQDAINFAKEFNEQVSLTGIILTRVDGDSRGGAALSMRQVTGCPIKFIGVGEKITDLTMFYPDRIASSILGMGDIISLVEKAEESIEHEEGELLEEHFKKGNFTLEDLAKQLKMMKKMGGFSNILGMIPGMGGMKSKIDDVKVNDNMFGHMQAIISSMTKKERIYPKILNASRKRRIAKGSGTTVQEINRLLKQHRQMGSMAKKLGKIDKKQFSTGNIMSLFNSIK